MIDAIQSGARMFESAHARLDRAAHELSRPGQPDRATDEVQREALAERTEPAPRELERATEGAAAWTEADVVRSAVDLVTAPQEAAAGASVVRNAVAAYESVMSLKSGT